jgi:hypothetical protein
MSHRNAYRNSTIKSLVSGHLKNRERDERLTLDTAASRVTDYDTYHHDSIKTQQEILFFCQTFKKSASARPASYIQGNGRYFPEERGAGAAVEA